MIIPTVILISCLILFNGLVILFKLFQPKKINSLYGYRTSQSMKSDKSWKYSNKIFSNLLFISTLIYSAIIILMYFLSINIKVLLLLELLGFVFVLVFSVIVVENKVKKFNDIG